MQRTRSFVGHLVLAFYATSFATNILVTFVTGYPSSSALPCANNTSLAGRIYWLARIGASILGERIRNRYRLIVAIMCVWFLFVVRSLSQSLSSLESGLIYSAALLAVLVLSSVIAGDGRPSTLSLAADYAPLLVQIAVGCFQFSRI
jgi:hypothetical protein